MIPPTERNALAQASLRANYNSTLYVNRLETFGSEAPSTIVEEIVSVADALALDKQHPIQNRTLIISGEQGTGKSWLCRHLHRTVFAKNPNVRSFLIAFDAIAEDAVAQELLLTKQSLNRPHESIVNDIVMWLSEKLNASRRYTNPDDATKSIVEVISKYSGAVVFVWDAIFEQNWDLLELLETYLLASLAHTPNVLQVMTGRGKLYPWDSPQLRVHARYCQLRNFDVTQTQQQIEKLGHPCTFDRLQSLQDQSLGNPLINLLLVDKNINSEQLLDEILKPVDVPIRDYLRALAVLEDGFREDEVRTLLRAMADSTEEKAEISRWNLAQVRKIRDQLIATRLVRWDDGHYIIDSGVRAIIVGILQKKDRNRYETLLRAAHEMYQDWADKYKERYKESAAYYQLQANKYEQLLGQTVPSGAAEDARKQANSRENQSPEPSDMKLSFVGTGEPTSVYAQIPLIGRRQELDAIRQAILNSDSKAHIINIVHQGGTGKTYLMKSALEHLRNLGNTTLRILNAVFDFANIALHVPNTLALVICDTYTNSYPAEADTVFQNYRKKLAELDQIMASGNPALIIRLRNESLELFEEALEVVTNKHKLVIGLDTLERLVYAPGQTPTSRDQWAQSWIWLSGLLDRCSNLNLLVAGRPISEILIDGLNYGSHTSFTKVEIQPFSFDESMQYLEAVALKSTQSQKHNDVKIGQRIQKLTDEQRKVVHSASAGRPILLQLLLIYFAEVGIDQLPAAMAKAGPAVVSDCDSASNNPLERELVKFLKESHDYGDLIRELARLPKGANAELVSRLLSCSIAEAQEKLDSIRDYTIVKYREDGVYFLHDEMYRLLQDRLDESAALATTIDEHLKLVVDFYDEQAIDINNTLRKLIEPLERGIHQDRSHTERIVDALRKRRVIYEAATFYALRQDFARGFRRNERLAFETAWEGDSLLLQQLSSNLLIYLAEVENQFSRTEVLSVAEKQLIRGVVRVRRVIANSTEGRHLDAIALARDLRVEFGSDSVPESVNAALDVWEGAAHALHGHSDDLVMSLTLLTQAINLLRGSVDQAGLVVSNQTRTGDLSAASWHIHATYGLAHFLLGYAQRVRGLMVQAQRDYGQAIAFLRYTDFRAALAFANNNLGFVESELGDYVRADRRISNALDERRRLNLISQLALGENTLGILRIYQNRLKEAEQQCDIAINLIQAPYGDRQGELAGSRPAGLIFIRKAEIARRMARAEKLPLDQHRRLLDAVKFAEQALSVFSGTEDDLSEVARRVEALLELGCALQGWAKIDKTYITTLDFPKDFVSRSRGTFDEVIQLAGDFIFYRKVDAMVNRCWLEYDLKDESELLLALDLVRQTVPKPYWINSATGKPDVSGADAQPLVWPQLAKWHLIQGHRAMDDFESTSRVNAFNTAIENYVLGLEYGALLNPDVTEHRDLTRLEREIDVRLREHRTSMQNITSKSIETTLTDYNLGARVINQFQKIFVS